MPTTVYSQDGRVTLSRYHMQQEDLPHFRITRAALRKALTARGRRLVQLWRHFDGKRYGPGNYMRVPVRVNKYALSIGCQHFDGLYAEQIKKWARGAK